MLSHVGRPLNIGLSSALALLVAQGFSKAGGSGVLQVADWDM